MSTASNAECECSKENSRVDESAPFPSSQQFQQQPQQPSNANAKVTNLVHRELVVRPEHRLVPQPSLPDSTMDVQDQSWVPFRKVRQIACRHRAQVSLHVVGQVLIVMFLRAKSAHTHGSSDEAHPARLDPGDAEDEGRDEQGEDGDLEAEHLGARGDEYPVRERRLCCSGEHVIRMDVRHGGRVGVDSGRLLRDGRARARDEDGGDRTRDARRVWTLYLSWQEAGR